VSRRAGTLSKGEKGERSFTSKRRREGGETFTLGGKKFPVPSARGNKKKQKRKEFFCSINWRMREISRTDLEGARSSSPRQQEKKKKESRVPKQQKDGGRKKSRSLWTEEKKRSWQRHGVTLKERGSAGRRKGGWASSSKKNA